MVESGGKELIRSFKADIQSICREDIGRSAIIDARTGHVWTYGELLDAITGFSSLLWDAGLRPGDRLCSILPNSSEQLVAFLTALWLGVDFCPLSPLSTADEAQRFLLMCRSKVCLVTDKTDERRVKTLDGTTSRVPVHIDIDGDLRRYTGMIPPPVSDSGAMEGKLILFTSGTTSNPKAMVLDGNRLWSSAVKWCSFHTFLDVDSRFYNFLPMSYLGGLFNLGLIPLASRGSVVLSGSSSGASSLNFWREVREHGVNTLWLAPTVLRALMTLYRGGGEADKAREQVRVSFLGMAPISLEEKEQFEATFKIPLLENFALSETTFLTSERLDDPLPRSSGSVGKVLPWVELRLSPLDADSSESEIEIKSPFLFDGYLDSAGQVHQPLTSDGFFPTGDLGALDEGGILHLLGRSKEVIKRGGYLVLLRDLEEVAEDDPSVAEAAAVGVPDEFYGESSVLFVRLVEGVVSTRDSLDNVKASLTHGLAGFRWPSRIVAMKSFPKTESGKVQKRLLVTCLDSREGVLDSVDLKRT
jgi:acyl-CoA synthetase (AMP-forming)/AMP-acid ligase II